MKRPAAALCLIALWSGTWAASAAEAPQAPRANAASARDASIVGTVIDDATDLPITSASIRVSGGRSQGSSLSTALLTGSDGRFAVRGLVPGSHTITAGRSGYLAGSIDVDLAAGEVRTPLVLRLSRTAVIAGTITDEAGEPVVNVRVQLLRRSGVTSVGSWTTAAINTEATDDQGRFRIPGLRPGAYVVYAPLAPNSAPLSALEAGFINDNEGVTRELMGLGTGQALRGTLPGQPDSRMVGQVVAGVQPGLALSDSTGAAYVNTFYPSSTTLAGATPLTLTTGQERHNINIRLQPQRTVVVSGTLLGPDGPLGWTRVSVWPRERSGMTNELEIAATVSDTDGRFVLPHVPEGDLVLRVHRTLEPSSRSSRVTSSLRSGASASQTIEFIEDWSGTSTPRGLLWAEVPLAIGTRAVSGLIVTARRGLQVRGRFEFNGRSVRPSAEQLAAIHIRLTPVPSRSVFSDPAPLAVGATADVIAAEMAPGRYLVEPFAIEGWRLESVMHDGVDVTETPLTLASTDADLVFTLTDRRTTLSGVVRDDLGAPAAMAMVTAFSVDVLSRTAAAPGPRRFQTRRADTTGRYTFSDLPPGDYFVAVVPQPLERWWMEPDTLADLAQHASRVRLTYDQPATADLRRNKERVW